MKDDYIEFTDIENIKKALENAEIDYEELSDSDEIVLELEQGTRFFFDLKGGMTGLRPFQ